MSFLDYATLPDHVRRVHDLLWDRTSMEMPVSQDPGAITTYGCRFPNPASITPKDRHRCVGIFWYIDPCGIPGEIWDETSPDTGSVAVIVGYRERLDSGSDLLSARYAPHVTVGWRGRPWQVIYLRQHSSCWPEVAAQISASTDDYFQYPRGRVIYVPTTRIFEVYFSSAYRGQLEVMQAIAAWFDLCPELTLFRWLDEYCSLDQNPNFG